MIREHRLFEYVDWSAVQDRLALSPRELQVTRLLCGGVKASMIAAELDISLGTVKTHTRRIYRKLGLSGQTALALEVMAVGLEAAHPAAPRAARQLG